MTLVLVMHAVEAYDFHAIRYLNADPLGMARSPPFLLHNRRVAFIQEADSIDVTLSFLFLADVELDCTDRLFGIDEVNLRVESGTFNGVYSFALDAVREGHFHLIQVSISLEAKAAQLDLLVEG